MESCSQPNVLLQESVLSIANIISLIMAMQQMYLCVCVVTTLISLQDVSQHIQPEMGCQACLTGSYCSAVCLHISAGIIALQCADISVLEFKGS